MKLLRQKSKLEQIQKRLFATLLKYTAPQQILFFQWAKPRFTGRNPNLWPQPKKYGQNPEQRDLTNSIGKSPV